MIFKNKKGNVAQSVILWIFFTFFYFMIGYDIVKLIVDDLNTFTGAMGFLASIIPFIPVIGLMWWGYTILNPIISGGSDVGGDFEQ